MSNSNCRIEKDLPIGEYHDMKEYIGSSLLKAAFKSASQYKKAYYKEYKVTDDLIFGDFYHTLVLEPEKVRDKFAFFTKPYPESNMNKKENKQEYERLVEENPEKRILNIDKYNQGTDMLRVLKAYRRDGVSIIDLILNNNSPEVSYIIEDFNGVKAKCRFDIDSPRFIGDLKTTKHADPEKFVREISDYGYDIQAAWYTDIYEHITGKRLPFFIIAQEKEEPFDFCIYDMEDFLEIGRQKYEIALERIRSAHVSNTFEGYTHYIPEGKVARKLVCPPWMWQSVYNNEKE